MIHVAICPNCQETISFLDNEETKMCKFCGEVIFNTKVTKPTFKKVKNIK